MRHNITRPAPPVERLRQAWRRGPTMTISIATSALLLAGAIGRYGPAGPEASLSPAPAAGPVDYTVVAKTLYKNGQTFGKSGYYVTIILDGHERERPTSAACYAAARVDALLAEHCR